MSSFLETHQHYLSANQGDYLFGRLQAMTRCALQHRTEEPHVSKQHWSGSTLIFSWHSISDKSIDVQQLRKQVFYHVRQHEIIFMNLFPASFIPHLDIIQIQSFVDDESAGSIFTIPENQSFLSPLVDKLIKCMEEEHITKSQVFQRSRQFLSSLLTCIYTTTGTPPRAFQVADFRYATSGTTKRNFRIIEKMHGVFVNPKAANSKTSPRTTPIDTLWLLSYQVTRTLLLFLGVYRPVEAFYAAKVSKWDSNHLLPLETHIFCNLERMRSIIWSDDNVEEHLKENSPLQVEAFPHGLIMSQIISRFFKPMLELLESAVLLDMQSQHASCTSRRHYAIERLQNVTGSQYSTWKKHVMLGQAIHAFFYLIPPIANLEVQKTLNNNHTLQMLMTDIDNALYVARHAVVQTYQLATLPTEKVSIKVRFLMHTLPFIYQSVNEPVGALSLEQQMLVDVAQALKDEDSLNADVHLVRLLAMSGILVSDSDMQKYNLQG